MNSKLFWFFSYLKVMNIFFMYILVICKVSLVHLPIFWSNLSFMYKCSLYVLDISLLLKQSILVLNFGLWSSVNWAFPLSAQMHVILSWSARLPGVTPSNLLFLLHWKHKVGLDETIHIRTCDDVCFLCKSSVTVMAQSGTQTQVST